MSGFKDDLNKDCGTPVVSQQVGGASGDATTLNGYDGAYYLNRSNHTGSIDIEDVDGLELLLDNKADLDSSGKVPLSQIPDIPTPPVDWGDVNNKPLLFPPTAHTHPISEVIGLDIALLSLSEGLSNKADASEVEDGLALKADITFVEDELALKSNVGHTHSISDVSGLQGALNSKLDVSEKGANNGLAELDADGKVPSSQIPDIPIPPIDWGHIDNKPTEFPPSAHTHAISDVTGLQGELDDKVDESDTTDVATAGKVVKYSNIGAVNTVEPQFPENAVPLSYLNAQGYVDTTLLYSLEYIQESQKGSSNGVAELDGSGKILSSQLPSYVDDVLSYPTQGDFPTIGETGKIYISEDSNLTYRWSGSAYVEISPSIALGETSSTAYRGDRGAAAYNHSQTTGNPHNTQIADIPALSTNLTSLQNQINGKVDAVVGKGLSDENYTLIEKNKLASIDGEWYGTRAAYEAITSPDPNIKYYIEKE